MNTGDPAHQADDCQPLRQAVTRGEVKMEARVRGQYPGTPLGRGRLPGLRTIGYWDAVGPQSWGLPMHRNEGIEICYLLHGETVFATDRESVLLRPGDITITRPWQRHRLGDPAIRPCRMFWLILDVENRKDGQQWQFPKWIGPDPESRRELLRIFRASPRCHAVDEGRSLTPFLEDSCRRLADSGPLEAAHLADTVNHLLVAVARIIASEATDPGNDPHGFDPTVRGFFHGLEASVEIAAEPWTVAEMARACRVGPTYLNASCKEIFNATPSDQLCRTRLAHAARLLREDPQRPVTDIAFAVGFNSSQHFATRFRRQFGTTPGAFREPESSR
ncbi:helix-turn-helix domain-containing protein [Haloferula sp. A504]|uniref:helix-turn-helix domain-containing protein n=1 Tax=Haloferula sp. A504 TaxID=3373601 RepID=UPI0031CA95FF|nr:AraC family transcriptional regulator [Verrucomicrobiaceae bacterium E54]